MLKVMQINVVYKRGSTGKIMYDIHTYLKNEGYKSIVCYGRGEKISEENVYKNCNELYAKFNNLLSRFSGIAYGGCYFSTNKLIRFIEKENPNIVHLHCINGFFVNIYKIIAYLKEQKIKTVLTLHAEFMHTANCGCSFGCKKWKTGCGSCPDIRKSVNSYFIDNTANSFTRMKLAFSGFEDNLLVVGVSNWLSKQAKESPIMENMKIITVHNGIDVSRFFPRNVDNLRECLKIKNEDKVILWVTSQFSHAKGKDYFFELVEKMGKEYKFLVAGAEAPSNYEGDIIFLGKISNQEYLSEIYSLSDVVISCSRQESYPTVSLEAQCCGTPFVGFDVGGVAETIRDGMGEVIELGALDAFKNAVEKWSRKKSDISKETIEECRMYNSNDRMSKEYLRIYNKFSEHK